MCSQVKVAAQYDIIQIGRLVAFDLKMTQYRIRELRALTWAGPAVEPMPFKKRRESVNSAPIGS